MSFQGFGAFQAMHIMSVTNRMMINRRRNKRSYPLNLIDQEASPKQAEEPVLHTSGMPMKSDPTLMVAGLLIIIPTILLMLACYAMSLSTAK